MIKKTIIPRKLNTYSSFPTFTTDEDNFYLYYRQSNSSSSFVHGLKGVVKCWKLSKKRLIGSFSSNDDIIFDEGLDQSVFQNKEQNELDSIVSRLESKLYTLVTRLYTPNIVLQSYISVSTTPIFNEREKIIVPNTEWFVLYGKAIKAKEGYIFPAYGSITKEPGERALLLQTDDFKKWSILSYQPLSSEYILNESSIVFDNEKYFTFMRSNKFPFSIWYATSIDLKNWSAPEKIIDKAHAPMATYYNDRVIVSYRDLEIKTRHYTSIIEPFTAKKTKLQLDEYVGSLYDGGYSDIGIIDNKLFAVYYLGNQTKEPYIKGALLTAL